MKDVLVPRMKAVAPDTWELRAFLGRTQEETARIPLTFPKPALVVGCKATVVRASAAGGLLIPTTEDILVLLDLDNQRRFTSEGQSTAANSTSQFVNLSALDTDHRDLMIEASAAKPVFGATFAWWRFLTGTPYYEDALIAISFFVQEPIPGMGFK